MIEQMALFEEPLTEDNLADKFENIIEQAREQYGYNKMHTSGMYELIKSAPESDLYEILEMRKIKNALCLYFDNQLYIKFIPKKLAVNVTQELYTALMKEVPAEKLTGNAAPKGGLCVTIALDEQPELLKKAIKYLVENKKPSYKFGCCSMYKECSKAKHCLHENQYYAKGCQYRNNLDQGKIFY